MEDVDALRAEVGAAEAALTGIRHRLTIAEKDSGCDASLQHNLVVMLENQCNALSFVRSPNVPPPGLKMYTGFVDFRSLDRAKAGLDGLDPVRFDPLGSNRAINQAVVDSRVQKNMVRYDETYHETGVGRYLDFGQIYFLVILDDHTTFYIMDGQVR